VAQGDAFDAIVKYARWLAKLGDHAYAWCLRLNHWYNHARLALGSPYCSLAAFPKTRATDAGNFMSDFEHAMAEEAKRPGLEGVVGGPIQKAEMKSIDGMLYCNDGDWL